MIIIFNDQTYHVSTLRPTMYRSLSLSQVITVSRLLLGSTIIAVQSSIYFHARSVPRNNFGHRKAVMIETITPVELSLYWRSYGPYTLSSVLTSSESILARCSLPRTEVIRCLNPFHLRRSVLLGISTLHRQVKILYP